MYKNKIGIILIIVGISVITYGAFLDNSKISKESEENTTPSFESIPSVASSTMVDDATGSTNKVSDKAVESGDVKKFDSSASLKVGTKDFKLEFNKGEVLYDSLKRLQTKGEIVMGGKEYSGLGYFIEEINELKPEKGKSLILFINNKKAMVGVSGYKLNNGDLIEFRIEDTY